MLRVRNLYLLSCARVPRIVLIILAYCKCIYNRYSIIKKWINYTIASFIAFLFLIFYSSYYSLFILSLCCPQLASAEYIDTWIKFIIIIIIIITPIVSRTTLVTGAWLFQRDITRRKGNKCQISSFELKLNEMYFYSIQTGLLWLPVTGSGMGEGLNGVNR